MRCSMKATFSSREMIESLSASQIIFCSLLRRWDKTKWKYPYGSVFTSAIVAPTIWMVLFRVGFHSMSWTNITLASFSDVATDLKILVLGDLFIWDFPFFTFTLREPRVVSTVASMLLFLCFCFEWMCGARPTGKKIDTGNLSPPERASAVRVLGDAYKALANLAAL